MRADATTAGGPTVDAGGARDSGRDAQDAPPKTEASVPPGFDAGIDGACPSAVLLGSPLPMLGCCSTRDGRARVAGPLHPRITFSNPDPIDGQVLANASFVAADGSGGAFLEGNTLIGDTPTELFARIDGSGQVAWVTTIPATVVASVSPFLLQNGTLQVLAYAMTGSSIESFDTATGVLTSTPLPPALSGAGIPAVGADGSLYVPVVSSAEVVMKTGVISRLLPDGTLAWTSANLANFTVSFGGFFTLALGPEDVSIVAEADTSGVALVVIALSSHDGSIVWKTSIPGQIVGGVAVAPDGSSAAIASNGEQSFLSVLEPTGSIRVTYPVEADSVDAVGLNGELIVGGSLLDPSGTTLWGTSGTLLHRRERHGLRDEGAKCRRARLRDGDGALEPDHAQGADRAFLRCRGALRRGRRRRVWGRGSAVLHDRGRERGPHEHGPARPDVQRRHLWRQRLTSPVT